MNKLLLLSTGIYFFDVVTKMLVRKKMELGQEIALLPFFSLTHIENTGVAFGLLQGRNTLLLLVGLGILGFLFWYTYILNKEDKRSALFVAIICGGALGNLTDRVLFGRVTDFLDFFIGRYHWPAFNVADSAICVGAALLLWRQFRYASHPA